MRLRLLLLPALLLAGCTSGTLAGFDAGHDVHVILVAEPPPGEALLVQPVSTLGSQVRDSPRRTIAKDAPGAIEVALFSVPSGEHRFSFWEPRTRSGARATLSVDHELWVVVVIRPGKKKAGVEVHRRPPHDRVGNWQPLVAVPD